MPKAQAMAIGFNVAFLQRMLFRVLVHRTLHRRFDVDPDESAFR